MESSSELLKILLMLVFAAGALTHWRALRQTDRRQANRYALGIAAMTLWAVLGVVIMALGLQAHSTQRAAFAIVFVLSWLFFGILQFLKYGVTQPNPPGWIRYPYGRADIGIVLVIAVSFVGMLW